MINTKVWYFLICQHGGAVEILTIDEAALLWGGIDPVYCRDFSDAGRYRHEQYQQAFIARRAFLSGIALGTLPTNELWCIDHRGDSYLHADKQLPSINEIDTLNTTVNNQALISWAEKKKGKDIKTGNGRLCKKSTRAERTPRICQIY